ncbi:MAG TPA: diacylglycerol kinase family protein [Gaiellaceae bacterium]|jgi:diacylglycerol kinase family enzyme|nr:diacylglycerol kinase family protein [Gaiellaceae bacterium]
MAGTLIVNPRAGDSRPSAEELAEAAGSLEVAVHVLAEGDDLERLAREAPAGPLGMAGGDGSLAPVAAACVERDLPFVCVPFGTRNHFARDLGLDRGDPLAALAAFGADAVERRVDVGRAGERLFLNNVSLGLYAGLVHDRERRRRSREAFARLRALRRLVSEREPVALTLDGAPLQAHLLLVANNPYTPMQAFSAGERERLDSGRLALYVGSGALPPHWEERLLERVVVGSPAGTVRAAIDGEPAELATPLELESLPGALRVLVPAGRMAE